MTQQNPYTPFVDELIKKAGFDTTLSQEEVEEYKQQLIQEVEKRVGIMVMKEMPEDQYEEFVNKIASGAQSLEMMEYLQAHIPDFHTKLQNTLVAFGNDFLS